MESLARYVKAKNTGQQWSNNMRKSLITNSRISLAHLFSRRRWQKLWRNIIRSRSRTSNYDDGDDNDEDDDKLVNVHRV